MKNTSQSQITESSKFVLKMFLNLANVPQDLDPEIQLFSMSAHLCPLQRLLLCPLLFLLRLKSTRLLLFLFLLTVHAVFCFQTYQLMAPSAEHYLCPTPCLIKPQLFKKLKQKSSKMITSCSREAKKLVGIDFTLF